MTKKWHLNLSWTKWGLQFQLGQIRDSPQFVLNEICDSVAKKMVNDDSKVVISDTWVVIENGS